ncbi:hypothetical protein IKF27_03345 [Candidatus Saccharibacteria bacterium]|nr:hypothetical protein [Candidatus Saccharibacteria bacterium]
MNVIDFSKGTEKLVDPMQVGKTHHLQTKLNKLPVFLQRKIVLSSAKKASKMGFVVEPYAFFLFYEVDNVAKLQKDLPDGFVPMLSRAFVGDEERYYGIVSIFRVHTSAFWGARAEFYTIAKNIKTNLMSWVILDYLSDTISYDEKYGLRSPNAKKAVVTTTCEGDFLAEMKSEKEKILVEASLRHSEMRKLDEKLWIDGNTSIAYSKELGGDDGDLFSLTFLPDEMKEAWDIPLKDVKVAEIKAFPEIFKGKLRKAVCFPFAQHMLSDSPGASTHYGSKETLKAAAEKVDFSKLKSFGEK